MKKDTSGVRGQTSGSSMAGPWISMIWAVLSPVASFSSNSTNVPTGTSTVLCDHEYDGWVLVGENVPGSRGHGDVGERAVDAKGGVPVGRDEDLHCPWRDTCPLELEGLTGFVVASDGDVDGSGTEGGQKEDCGQGEHGGWQRKERGD